MPGTKPLKPYTQAGSVLGPHLGQLAGDGLRLLRLKLSLHVIP